MRRVGAVVTVRIPVRYAGRTLVFEHESANDHIARYHASGYVYERAMIDRLRALPEVRGRWALDIGAHVGNHAAALLAGGEVAGVVACEPTSRYDALVSAMRHVEPLGSRWLAMRVVVGDGELVQLHDGPPGNTGMARVTLGGGIVTQRIDDIARGVDVGLIKVDVEGHELHVLRGARETLARCRPALAVEGDAAILSAELEPLGYVLETSWNATPTHVFRSMESVT